MNKVRYTEEGLLKIGSKFKSVKEFRMKEPSAYRYARDRDILKLMTWLEKDSSPATSKHRTVMWTRESIEDVSFKCGSLEEFKRIYPSAYSTAMRRGWNDLLNWYYKPRKNIFNTLTISFCFVS